MTVCKFFAEGRCRNGDNCRFEHPRGNQTQQQNRFAPLSTQHNNNGGRSRAGGFGGGDRYRPETRNNDQKLPYLLDLDAIRSDLTDGTRESDKPIWKLSAYGPGKEAPRQLLEGAIEVSPEELRVQAYLAQETGQFNEYLQKEANAFGQADQQCWNILNDLDGAIQYVLDGGKAHPNRIDETLKPNGPFRASTGSFGQAVAPAFGSASGGNSVGFGQPSQMDAGSGFGQPSQMGGGGNSAFGQPSSMGQKPAFGAPTQPGGGSAFGAPSQMGAGSAFGAPSALGGAGGGSAFGAPSSLGQKPAFGQPTQPSQSAFGQSGFGQTTKPAFGAPSQPAGAFGQPSALGGAQQGQNSFGSQSSSQPNPFASTANQPSAFGQPNQTQTQQTNPFGGSGGNQSNANPFTSEKPAFGSSGFGQPAQSTTGGFGQGNQQPNGMSNGGQAQNPFGQPAPTAPSGGSMFGSAQTNGMGNRSEGPTVRTAQGTLSAWKGAPVMYDEDRNPTYKTISVNPQTGQRKEIVERIWHPSGVPERPNPDAEAANPEIYMGELGAILKGVYEYVMEREEFKDGIMPELPPKREWVRWDL